MISRCVQISSLLTLRYHGGTSFALIPLSHYSIEWQFYILLPSRSALGEVKEGKKERSLRVALENYLAVIDICNLI